MPRHSIWVIREPQEWPVAKTCYYTFSNMDALFDFVTGLGLIPFVELAASREHDRQIQSHPHPPEQRTRFLFRPLAQAPGTSLSFQRRDRLSEKTRSTLLRDGNPGVP